MQVRDYLKQQDVFFDVLPHRTTFDAQRMAQALDVPGEDVAKTVLLRCDGDCAVVVLPATRHVDLVKAGQALGMHHAELAAERDIGEHCPDCEIGALPPFGSQYGMKTLVEESLAESENIVFESNTHDEAIRMHVDDFRRLEGPIVASFATLH